MPANGAPMSLVTVDDFHKKSVATRSSPSIPKYEQALMRMNGAKSPPMPPAGSALTEEDKTTLIDWLADGAPAASGDDASCE